MSTSSLLKVANWSLAVLLTAAPVLADTPVSKSADERTTITSQRMTVRNQENKAIFEGAVVLTKGELIVKSDVMVVFFKPTDQAAPSSKSSETQKKPGEPQAKGADLPVMSNRAVSLIEATGKVRIIKADGQATCQKAVYDGAEEKIVLTGDPIAWQNGTKVTGQKITMYLAEDRSVVEGGSRVLIDKEGAAR